MHVLAFVWLLALGQVIAPQATRDRPKKMEYGSMDECTNRQLDGWVDRLIDGWKDG